VDAQPPDEDGANACCDLVTCGVSNSRVICGMDGEACTWLPHAALGADFRAGADGFPALVTILLVWSLVTRGLAEVG
jgi:hypothetical protein